MTSLLNSFFYKLFRDSTFRITMIIGVILSVLMSLLYSYISKSIMGSGAYMFISSISPSQNFGIAIPINLVIFTTLLFNQGIIRNQVIVGNSKTKVYFSLLIGGAVFTLFLIAIYVGLCVAISTIINGFYPTINEVTLNDFIDSNTIVKLIVLTITGYLMISTYSVFISSTIRSSGPCIPLAIVPLILFGVISIILNMLNLGGFGVPNSLMTINRIINPFNIISSTSMQSTLSSDGSTPRIMINQDDFVCNLINNIVLIVTFSSLGIIIFNKKDIK